MSDNPPAYPPPPPPSVPPPPPGYGMPPGYQGPTAPDYPQPYQYQPPQPYPGTGSAGIGGAAGLMSQFTGRAGWSCLIGVATIVAPFFFNFVFYVLALIGLLYGIQAIRRGQLIGGVVGIVLNAIGGLLTIFLLANR